MIKFKTLSIRNFLSYGEITSTINLDTQGTTLIVGENLDNNETSGSNGVGKTTWVNALVYVLYGKPLTSISLDHLVNNINKKNMLVEVSFEKNNKLITIRRARKEKKLGNYTKVFIRGINDELNEEMHDVTQANSNNINEFITELLGIEYDLFIRIVTFSATHLPFLDLPLRQQAEMMEDLFGLSQLSDKASILKEKVKSTKQDIEITEKLNEQRKKEHERHDNQIKTAKFRVSEWDTDHKNKINGLKLDLDKYKSIDIDGQEKLLINIDNLSKEKEKLTSEKSNIKTDINNTSKNIEVLESTITNLTDSINTIKTITDNTYNELKDLKDKSSKLPSEAKLNEDKSNLDQCKKIDIEIDELANNAKNIQSTTAKLLKDKEKMESEISHLKDSKCPYCHQNFAEAKEKMEACESKLNEIVIELDKLNNDNKRITILITKHQVYRDEIMNSVEYSYEEIDRYNRLRVEYVDKIEALTNDANTKNNNDKIMEFTDKIEKCVSGKDVLKHDLEDYNQKLSELDTKISDISDNITDLSTTKLFDSMLTLMETKNKIKILESKINDVLADKNPYVPQLEELTSVTLEIIDIDRMNDLTKLLDHQTYLVKLLTKKDSFIRKNLLKQNLAYLNSRLREYLLLLGLPHTVTFTEEMSASISQFGRELSFGNLSSGQKARVNISLALAFRDVLQKSNESINICVLDEVLDVGLDGSGVQNAARALKSKASSENMSMFIISHRDEVGNIFDNRLTIQMENSFSRVKME